MANWVKGKLKIRGKPEDIKRWVEECLHCYFTKWFRDGSYEDELVDDRQQKPFGYNHFLYNYGKPDILRDAVY